MLKLSTKADHLIALKKVITKALVPATYKIFYADWKEHSGPGRLDFISTIIGAETQNTLNNWVIRSSSHNEDQECSSGAGKFLSVINIPLSEIPKSIDKVFASYENTTDKSELFIQPYFAKTKLSGVAFTHDQDTGAPYRIFNWEHGSDTTAITGGKVSGHTTIQSPDAKSTVPHHDDVNKVLDELLEKLPYEALEIEYAVSFQSKLILLQVRPLILSQKVSSPSKLKKILDESQKILTNRFSKSPLINGDYSIFAMMPDWNPAEIIGTKPKKLALSLYKNLITDGIWAYQRSNYGYKNLRGMPLLVDIYGIPFIDARVSFNSLIPNDLNGIISEKLINAYLERLKNNPELHDKIEFEIVMSCYHFSLDKKFENLNFANFTDYETKTIKKSLLKLTQKIINTKDGLWLKDVEKIKVLAERRGIIQNSKLSKIDKIYWLLEDCKRYGTLPFAGIARAAFIAMEILNSLVNEELLTIDEKIDFLSTVNTVNKQLLADTGVLTKEQFLNKYGHLRPGTYDITSYTYDELYDYYFLHSPSRTQDADGTPKFILPKSKLRLISHCCMKHGLTIDATDLLVFIKNAIEWREMAKFEFTKNISIALNLIHEIGKSQNLTRQDLSYLDINDVLKMQSSPRTIETEFRESIEKGQRSYLDTEVLRLPEVILAPTDVLAFRIAETVPNFITIKTVTAETCEIESGIELKGKIVFIPNADPGYDWIFTKKIAGFVTLWGGLNSHMAIRASELGLPAVVGSGEANYKLWVSKPWITLNCDTGKVDHL